MGEKTGIAWTDSTWNPWIGCTKVSSGCDFCYADRQNKLYKWAGEGNWGPGVERHRTTASNWRKPIQWAKEALEAKTLRRIFCLSLGDILDGEVAPKWRDEAFSVMDEAGKIGAGYVEWLILTKRHGNLEQLPAAWLKEPPSYIRMGVSAENQVWWDRRVSTLLKVWKGKNFVSVEPLLGPMEIVTQSYVDWVIVGGESGPDARRCDPRWVHHIQFACADLGIPFFFKQQGEWAWKEPDPEDERTGVDTVYSWEKVGAKKAGHLLGGKEYHEFPKY